MVDMRMREHHRINIFWIDRQIRPVFQAQLFQALKQAAIDHNPVTAGIQQIF